MRLYNYAGETLVYKFLPATVIVAANDSSNEDKKIADYICDGKNDEIEIQKAINFFSSKSGQVILCNGNYYIDSFYSDDQYGKFGLYVPNPKTNHDLILRGISHPNRVDTYRIGIGATINLGVDAYNSLGDSEKLTLFGALGPITYPNLNITIENIGFNTPGTSKKITVINLQYFANARIDFVHMGLFNNVSPSPTPNSEYIGIRGLPGWNFGAGYFIRNCFLYGFGVAFDIGGEHLIMEDCGCRFCDITYRFNAYDSPSKMSHPQTIINCCEEECVRSMYFCRSSTKQTITFIDFNIEERPSEYPNFPRRIKAVEEEGGNYRGIITYTANYENYINSNDIDFWENGSGVGFKTVNTAHKFSGTTSERNSYKPQYMQEYYDTDLNKKLIYNGSNWVDMNGTIIS